MLELYSFCHVMIAISISKKSFQATAEFPNHFEQLHDLIDKAGGLHTTQQRLSAEMSDHSNLIRSLVVSKSDCLKHTHNKQ